MASSCIPMKKIRRLRLYVLDACGRMPITGNIVLDWDGYNSFQWQPAIDDGDEEKVTNLMGQYCIDDLQCPIDRGEDITLIGCKENDTLSSILGMGNLVVVSSALVGFDRLPISCAPNIAIEVLFDTPTLCDNATAPVCPALLFPLVTRWKDASTRTADGKTTIKGTFSGHAAKNGRLFELMTATQLPLELGHWKTYLTTIAAGSAWYYKRLVTCPDLSTYAQGCDLRALSAQTTG